KETGKKVVVIDNMASEDLADAAVMPYADIKGRKRMDNLYSGSPYVVIGESFLRARLAARPRAPGSLIPPPPPPPLNLLVTMGGADPNNLTDKVVEALWDMKDVAATVVLGPASKPSLWLRSRMMDNNSGFVFVEKAADLSMLMASAHIAFTAVGITVYELAFMGVPSVIIANYMEDTAFLDAFANAGFSLPLGYHGDVTHQSIRDAASRFIRDRALLKDMSTRAVNFTDGLGAGRIAGIIARLGVAQASSC
ncbi:MAG: hypothetical protein HY887_04265, partial [Deltaproteobacteria bacterium]|nr:hypothetical protein [Deltaproteobacteria bacterium]